VLGFQGPVLGCKNYLFAGSDRGGEHTAAIYSLTSAAKLNGLDQESYLRNLLERFADRLVNDIDELLPWNLAKESSAGSSRRAYLIINLF
jgi:transposase